MRIRRKRAWHSKGIMAVDWCRIITRKRVVTMAGDWCRISSQMVLHSKVTMAGDWCCTLKERTASVHAIRDALETGGISS